MHTSKSQFDTLLKSAWKLTLEYKKPCENTFHTPRTVFFQISLEMQDCNLLFVLAECMNAFFTRSTVHINE